MAVDAYVYVFTKDDFLSATLLLEDLIELSARRVLTPSVTIVDDSVNASSRRQVSRMAAAARLPIEIIRRRAQRSLARPAYLAPPWLWRPLGVAGYDLATCRNTAFAHFLSAPRKPRCPILFFDCDVRLRPCHLADRTYVVDGAKAITQMLDTVRADALNISGTPIVGRADFSLVDHLEHRTLDPTALWQIFPSLASSSFPAVMSEHDAHGLGQPLGMSGGVLCVDASALREAPMMHAYNEDLLWLSYLSHRGFRLLPAATPLIHADARKLRLSPSVLRRQTLGEVLWLIVEAHGWMGLVDNRFDESCGAAIDDLASTMGAIADRVQAALGSAPLTSVQETKAQRMIRQLRRESDRMRALRVAECQALIRAFYDDVSAWTHEWGSMSARLQH